ncbi:MAG TPA: ATP-binding protein [Streptosporangiaceae bacterium]|nr:ATP-binding protein [Streptosporangiaceae bacterium]
MTQRTKHSRLSIRYFDDRILLTESHAWAYFRIPTISYEFMTSLAREALATNLTVALAGIRMADAEVHLRIAHRSYPAAQWATGLHATSDGGPGWLPYLDEMYRQVWAKDFWTKEVYLGVRLGQRGVRAQLAGGVLAQFMNAYRAGEQAMGIEDAAIAGTEIARWTEQAERVGRTLGASSLAARHASADDVAWLFRHALTAGLGDPPATAVRKRKWGFGEIESLVEGEIHNGRTVLRIIHPSGESCVAFLSFTRFPDVMYFPEGEPWLHYADSLPFPVEASLRMRLIPPAKASKDVSRRLAHARDMDAHIREAGADLPIALAEQIEAARLLEHGITKERLPFVYGWHRLAVTAPDRELCVRRAEAVTEHYRDIGIDVVNSTGDQFSLLSESLPGDKVRLNSYLQRQPLYTIAGGMPTATVDLGDRAVDGGWVGPYIGETIGRARSVVHFDPLVAAARNRPTAVAITGEPGGGKTTLALLLILQLALRGVTVAVIDPKGDAESLVRLLAHRGRRARVLPLGSAAAGLLDPFSFGDDLAERRTMAAETLRLLLPGMSEERESAMIQAVGAVSSADRPSLGKVVDFLEAASDPASKNLGAVLRSMSEMRLARLCFSPSGGDRIEAEGWTTVFTLAGLTLPEVGLKRDDYSYEQRLSVALLYLVSQFARRLLNGMDRRIPKAIVLDEAWAVTSTPQGAKLIPEVSRMGRSRNTALILVSQNAGDLLNEQVTNCLSAVFAFRSSERAEVASVMSLLGLDPSEEHNAVLRSLGNGECIFRDLDGRAGRIMVDLISDELRRWLDTNPTRANSGEVPMAPVPPPLAGRSGVESVANGRPGWGAPGPAGEGSSRGGPGTAAPPGGGAYGAGPAGGPGSGSPGSGPAVTAPGVPGLGAVSAAHASARLGGNGLPPEVGGQRQFKDPPSYPTQAGPMQASTSQAPSP